MRQILAVLIIVVAATPAAAQEWQVARDRFPFIGTRLTIQVEAEAAGTLRLIRGEAGAVSVAGRAADGFVSSGLADGRRLTLAGVGGPFDYLVAVPENVWVEVYVPGQPLSRGVARGESGRWEWGPADVGASGAPDSRYAGGSGTGAPRASGSPDDSSVPITRWVPGTGATAPDDPGLYTTFTRDFAPERISIPDLEAARRVTVRVQGDRFRVLTSRPLSVTDGAADRLIIRPVDPMEIVLVIPAATETFVLSLGQQTALILDGDARTVLCTPVTEQRLSNGRAWFTFNPPAGDLRCGPESVQRHGG